tara:strand:- start:3848 stop:4288 length:441 start_codon:yes stop_codon:yes gene_type:complete
MKNKLQFYYLIEPKSCPRPRVTKSGHSFMPKEYTEWKKRFIESTIIQLSEIPDDFKTIERPISLRAQFIFPRPQRLQHREIPSKGLIHASKPDLDNCLKAVMDGLSDAQIFRDDNLVYEVRAKKEYCDRMDDGSFEYSHIKITLVW